MEIINNTKVLQSNPRGNFVCYIFYFFLGWPQHQILSGHGGRVNCLLYPHREHSRYDKNHLVSGGVDFAVCLWDLYAGTLLHRFCVHAGEITQLLVPPNNCSVSIFNKIWWNRRGEIVILTFDLISLYLPVHVNWFS